jgi:hypothetical protein
MSEDEKASSNSDSDEFYQQNAKFPSTKLFENKTKLQKKTDKKLKKTEEPKKKKVKSNKDAERVAMRKMIKQAIKLQSEQIIKDLAS